MAVDYQSKYELLLGELLKKLDSAIIRSQENAEESARASEQYCAELKRQLEHANHVTSELTQQLSSAQSELADMREKLRQFEEEGRGRTRPQKRTKRGNRFLPLPSVNPPDTVEALLSAMTSLSVRLEEEEEEEGEGDQSQPRRTYTCRVDSGKIVGHTFTLTLSTYTWEYTYSPVHCSPVLVARGNSLAGSLCFPDYMLGRFLINLLTVNFSE